MYEELLLRFSMKQNLILWLVTMLFHVVLSKKALLIVVDGWYKSMVNIPENEFSDHEMTIRIATELHEELYTLVNVLDDR